jgi:hypothetical protein
LRFTTTARNVGWTENAERRTATTGRNNKPRRRCFMRLVQKMALVPATLMICAFPAMASDVPKEAVKFTPGDLKWKPSARVPGLQRADMTGDDTKPGPYMYRIRFPANFKMQAHGHPDVRTYTILSGTWYIGWGNKFDESKLIALPAGSYYIEPAKIPHFVATKGEVEVQITGNGPTGVNYVDPAHAPKK